MENSDLKYWNAINLVFNASPKNLSKLFSFFKKAKEAWKANAQQLAKCGLKEKDINYFIAKRTEISPDAEFEKLAKEEIKIITYRDKNYPKLLREIYLPPALLYVKGKLNLSLEFPIAVVGTRKPTLYGKEIAQDISKDLTAAGITIVSGLALGIDTLAHRAAVEHNQSTIAVLGSGIDEKSIYPASNRRLAHDIIQNSGAIISEYPLGTLPLKQNFPARNRIISGLSLGVLVIEAPKESGALITANSALEQNREVFAIPGSIYSRNSEGTNNLIKMGAHLVTSASDILDELNLTQVAAHIKAKKIIPESPEEEKILDVLTKEPIYIDHLAKKTNLPINTISSVLTVMEMKGKVRNLGGMNYIKN